MARAMKDAGVAWIGKIPRGWAIRRLKDCAQVDLGKMLTPEPKSATDELLPYMRATNISEGEIRRSSLKEMWFSTAEAKKLRLRNGDVLVAEGGSIGLPLFVAGLMDGENICFQNAANRIRWGDDAKFLYFWMSWIYESGFHLNNVNAVSISHLTKEKLEVVPITYPPLLEQRAIADYLDQQTALIDQRLSTLAEKKSVLAELRKATIHEAITKGLNKTSPMKNSGNLFIGKIPAHWKIRRIKDISTKIGSGKTPLGGSSVYVPDGVMFLRSQNVWDEGLFLDDVVYIAETVDTEMRGSRIKVGDILINVTGASIGRSCIVPEGIVANVNQHVCIVRLRNKRIASFVARSMQAYATQRQIAEAQVGAAREGLNFEQIGNLFVVAPPVDEQLAIANYLDQQTQQIDAQLATLDEQVQVLKELRKAIIHEAVTGKIDLSGVVAGR